MSVLWPALVTIVIAVVTGLIPVPLRPSAAVWVFGAVAATAATVAGLALLLVSAAFVAALPGISAVVEWCPVIPVHHRVDWFVGVPALIGVSIAALRMRRLLKQRRWAVEGTQGKHVAVLDTDELVAFAAPGSPGCVVVSSGLLSVLEPRERQVVFAHERAHLSQHHDRHLLIASLSTAVVPLLAPLARRLRHATERCADEAAVAAMGGDREVVATAIARAALAASGDTGIVPSFGGGSVPARVGSLLGAEISPVRVALGAASATLTLVVMVGTSSIQLFHFAELVAHVCGW